MRLGFQLTVLEDLSLPYKCHIVYHRNIPLNNIYTRIYCNSLLKENFVTNLVVGMCPTNLGHFLVTKALHRVIIKNKIKVERSKALLVLVPKLMQISVGNLQICTNFKISMETIQINLHMNTYI